MASSYHKDQEAHTRERISEYLFKLPYYCRQFLYSLEQTSEFRTQLAYLMDINMFFEYLHENNPIIKAKDIKDISLDDLDKLEIVDFEEFLRAARYGQLSSGRKNSNAAIARKLSALKKFFLYLNKHEMLANNKVALIDGITAKSKPIIRMETNEVSNMLDVLDYGSGLTKRQQAYHKKTVLRDIAIVTLLLGTGIRVSECVGIDIDDVDFNAEAIRITRKGGNDDIVYFGEDVYSALIDYYEFERLKIIPAIGYEKAFFLSLQKKRISVDAVEQMVKKYAKAAVPLKKITPHKLRSTYGTNLYNETGDIYLVADVLGHKSVETTKAHYAAMNENRKRDARNIVKVRQDE